MKRIFFIILWCAIIIIAILAGKDRYNRIKADLTYKKYSDLSAGYSYERLAADNGKIAGEIVSNKVLPLLRRKDFTNVFAAYLQSHSNDSFSDIKNIMMQNKEDPPVFFEISPGRQAMFCKRKLETFIVYDDNGRTGIFDFRTPTQCSADLWAGVLKTFSMSDGTYASVVLSTCGENKPWHEASVIFKKATGFEIKRIGGRSPNNSPVWMKDIDNDGTEELVIMESIMGQGPLFTMNYYFPYIYSWNGKTFTDVTLKHSAYLKQIYNEVLNTSSNELDSDDLVYVKWEVIEKKIDGTIRLLDSMIKERSDEYKDFWEKNLRSLEDRYLKELKKRYHEKQSRFYRS